MKYLGDNLPVLPQFVCFILRLEIADHCNGLALLYFDRLFDDAEVSVSEVTEFALTLILLPVF